MTEKKRSPTCSTKCGPGWIDDGTMCRNRSYAVGPIGALRKSKSPAKTPTIDYRTRSALNKQSTTKRRNLPSLDDCKARMQSNLPKAHDKALDVLSHTIRFFSYTFNVVSSCASSEEIIKRLGKATVNFFAVYWSIYIDPQFRKKKGMEAHPSSFHIFVEILHPISRIISAYKKIKVGLERGEFSYECEYNGELFYKYKCGAKSDATDGYVNTFFGIPVGGIHICVDNMQDINNINKMAELIVHEASHKFAGTNDDSTVPWENAHVVGDNMPTNLK